MFNLNLQCPFNWQWRMCYWPQSSGPTSIKLFVLAHSTLGCTCYLSFIMYHYFSSFLIVNLILLEQQFFLLIYENMSSKYECRNDHKCKTGSVNYVGFVSRQCEVQLPAFFNVALFLRGAWLMVVPTVVELFVKSHCTESKSSTFRNLDKYLSDLWWYRHWSYL